MTPETSRLVVAVFDTSERAYRAAKALAADGFRPEQVRTIAEPDVPPDFPVDLVTAGVAADAGAYYAGEVRAGRCLLVVSCHPADAGSVMASVGPHGGSLRVPAQIRDGTC